MISISFGNKTYFVGNPYYYVKTEEELICVKDSFWKITIQKPVIKKGILIGFTEEGDEVSAIFRDSHSLNNTVDYIPISLISDDSFSAQEAVLNSKEELKDMYLKTIEDYYNK